MSKREVFSVAQNQEKPKFILSPEYKAQKTRGATMTGRLSFKQYEALVANGYEGESVMNWTKERASKTLSKTREKQGSIFPPKRVECRMVQVAPTPKQVPIRSVMDQLIEDGWLG